MKTVNEPTNIDGLRVIEDSEEMLAAIKSGESFYHWEYGNSLSPMINSMEYCKITPCNINEVKSGDAVFCVIHYPDGDIPMVHLVLGISSAGYDDSKWFKIGTSQGFSFGWTKDVLGIAKGTDIYQDTSV